MPLEALLRLFNCRLCRAAALPPFTSFLFSGDDVNKDIDVVVRSSTKVDLPGGGSVHAPVSQDLVPLVSGVNGVQAAEGQAQGQVSILDKSGDPMGNANTGPPTFGLNWLTKPDLNGWRLASGGPPTGADQVVLDIKTAEKAGYAVGDTVKIQLNSGIKEFTVVGIAFFGAGNAANNQILLNSTDDQADKNATLGFFGFKFAAGMSY